MTTPRPHSDTHLLGFRQLLELDILFSDLNNEIIFTLERPPNSPVPSPDGLSARHSKFPSRLAWQIDAAVAAADLIQFGVDAATWRNLSSPSAVAERFFNFIFVHGEG